MFTKNTLFATIFYNLLLIIFAIYVKITLAVKNGYALIAQLDRASAF